VRDILGDGLAIHGNCIGQLFEVNAAMVQLAPGIANADDGPLLKDVSAEALCAKTAAMRQAPAIGAIQPVAAAEFMRSHGSTE